MYLYICVTNVQHISSLLFYSVNVRHRYTFSTTGYYTRVILILYCSTCVCILLHCGVLENAKKKKDFAERNNNNNNMTCTQHTLLLNLRHGTGFVNSLKVKTACECSTVFLYVLLLLLGTAYIVYTCDHIRVCARVSVKCCYCHISTQMFESVHV